MLRIIAGMPLVDAAQVETLAMADDGVGDASTTRRVELIYR